MVIDRSWENGALKGLKATTVTTLTVLDERAASSFLVVIVASVVVFSGAVIVLHFLMLGSYKDVILLTSLAIVAVICLQLLSAPPPIRNRNFPRYYGRIKRLVTRRRGRPGLALFAAVQLLGLFLAHSLFAQALSGHPDAQMVADVRYSGQRFTEDCEAAALEMALGHEGIVATQSQILAAMGVASRAPVVSSDGRVLQWGNPDTSFVGQPNADSISTRYDAASGYGTYAPNVARVAAELGGTVLWSGTGLTRDELESYLSAGHPVVAWVGNRAGQMRYATLATWRAWDGTSVRYPDPASGVYEHCVLVAGWDTSGVFVDDPLDGARNGGNINPVVGPGWLSWSSFLQGFRTFNGMAVVLK